MKKQEGIILSMTPQERNLPEIIKSSRKKRIANGAGVHVQEVNKLINQFEQMQSMMKKMGGSTLNKMMKSFGGVSEGMIPNSGNFLKKNNRVNQRPFATMRCKFTCRNRPGPTKFITTGKRLIY